MRRPIRLLALTFAVASLLSGCAALRGLFQDAFKRPDLRFHRLNLKDLSLAGANLETVWALENPNPLGLSLAEIDYTLFIEGKKVVAGKPSRGLQIPANDRAFLEFPANVKFQELVPTLGVFLNQDTAKYRAEGHIGVQTPIGVLKFPLQKEGVFEVPKVPNVAFQPPRIKSMTLTGATLEIPLQITNRNSFPLPVGGITGALSIAGARVGNVSTGNLGLLQGKGAQTVMLPVTVNFASALQAANALRQGRGTVALSGNLQSGTASVPINLQDALNFIR